MSSRPPDEHDDNPLSSAQWIGGGHLILAPVFHLPPRPDHGSIFAPVKLFITAVGCYDVALNGQRLAFSPALEGGVVGREDDARGSFLNPGWATVPTMALRYDAYDLSEHVRRGPNYLRIHLGMCKFGITQGAEQAPQWRASLFCEDAHAAAANSNCLGVIAALQISTTGSGGGRGRTMVLATSASNALSNVGGEDHDHTEWRVVLNPPIRYSHLFHGEIFDTSLWKSDDFYASCTSCTEAVRPYRWKTSPPALVENRHAPRIRVVNKLRPVAIWSVPCAAIRSPPGGKCAGRAHASAHHYVLDFGENVAGFVRVDFVALKQKFAAAHLDSTVELALRHSEMLYADTSRISAAAGRGQESAASDGYKNNTIFPQFCSYPCAGVDGFGNVANQTELVRISGDFVSDEVWTPSFSYHGFRYLQVQNWPDSVAFPVNEKQPVVFEAWALSSAPQAPSAVVASREGATKAMEGVPLSEDGGTTAGAFSLRPPASASLHRGASSKEEKHTTALVFFGPEEEQERRAVGDDNTDRVASLSRDLNRLVAAVVATHQANLVSIPTDCPHREKRGWGADAWLSSGSALLNLDGLTPFYENWLQSMRATQQVSCTAAANLHAAVAAHDSGMHDVTAAHDTLKIIPANPFRPTSYRCCASSGVLAFGCAAAYARFSGADFGQSLPDVMPYESPPYGGWPGDLTWNIAPVMVLWEMVVGAAGRWGPPVDGFRQRSSDLFESLLMPLMDFYERHEDFAAPGLATFSAYYGDWLALEQTDPALVTAFCYVLATHRMSELAGKLGKTAESVAFDKKFGVRAAKFRRLFFNETTKEFGSGSQTANVLGLFLQGLGFSGSFGPKGGRQRTPRGTRTVALQALLTSLERNQLRVGIVGGRFLFEVLAAAAEHRIILRLFLEKKYPSFGFMLDYGPGTLWESWYWQAGMSLNHPALTGGLGRALHTIAGGTYASGKTARADVVLLRDVLLSFARGGGGGARLPLRGSDAGFLGFLEWRVRLERGRPNVPELREDLVLTVVSHDFSAGSAIRVLLLGGFESTETQVLIWEEGGTQGGANGDDVGQWRRRASDVSLESRNIHFDIVSSTPHRVVVPLTQEEIRVDFEEEDGGIFL